MKGTASMWALSHDKQTVQLTVPPTPANEVAAPMLRLEFDRNALEATLAMLVQMHFEMMRTAPAEIPRVRH